jgi:hypothetical protein
VKKTQVLMVLYINMKRLNTFSFNSSSSPSASFKAGSKDSLSSSLKGSFDGSIVGYENREFKKDKNCCICDKKFGMSLRRHHCRFCGSSVCADHSMKRRAMNDSNDLFRICDMCDKTMQDEEVKREISDQLDKLEAQLNLAKETNERLYDESMEKIELANQLELELKRIEKSHELKEEELLKQLRAEQERGMKTKLLVQQLQKDFESSQENESTMSEKCKCTEEKLHKYRTHIDELKEKKEELISQVGNLCTKLKASLPLDEVNKVLCPRCRKRINEFYRIESVIIPEEEESIASASIVDLIRRSTGDARLRGSMSSSK